MRNPMLDQVDDACWRVPVNIVPSRSAKRNAGVWDEAVVRRTSAEWQNPPDPVVPETTLLAICYA